MKHAGLALLWLTAALPAAFILAIVQWSAITVPFWDHCELMRVIDLYYTGQLDLEQLWRPHNHSRPFTYRTIYLANAILTKWDIRSEYLIHLSTIMGAFLLQASVLWRLTGRRITAVFLVWLSLLSLIAFSPVGHNNHWWSMMTQLTLTHLLIFYALTQVAFAPEKLSANLLAALACWLATYTLTNGLVATAVCAVIVQLSQPNWSRPNRWTIFWTLNLIALVAAYFPGLPQNRGGRPGLGALFWFSCSYLGMPVRGLIDYPYRDMFDVPRPVGFSGGVGIALVVLAAGLLWKYKVWEKRFHPAVRLAVGSILFAGGSAVLTGWGRAAFDEVGVSNGNSSRYAIYGAYLVTGLIYLVAGLSRKPDSETAIQPLMSTTGGGVSEDRSTTGGTVFSGPGGAAATSLESDAQPGPRLSWVGLMAFVLIYALGARAYADSIRIYRNVRDFNRILAESYRPGADDEVSMSRIFPRSDFVVDFKAKLKQWELGPYRHGADVPWEYGARKLEIPHVDCDPRPLSEPVEMSLISPVDEIRSVEVLLSTYGRTNPGEVWLEVRNAEGQLLGQARQKAATLQDNAYAWFVLGSVAPVQGKEVRLRIRYVRQPGEPGIVACWVPKNGTPQFVLRLRGQ